MVHVKKKAKPEDETERDILLISKIYKSFENLEETLKKLQMEEPLYITNMAKKSFADSVFEQIKKHREKIKSQKLVN